MGFQRTRDTQVSRVYKAEHLVLAAMDEAGRLERLDLPALELAVDKTWTAVGPQGARTPSVKWLPRQATATGANYNPRTHTVSFRRGSRACSQLIVCHELIHAVMYTDSRYWGGLAWHGPEFVGLYKRAVDRTMPFKVAEILRRSMRAWKVRG